MNYKKKIYWIVIVSVVTILISLALALPEIFGLCGKNDTICIDEYIYKYDTVAMLLLVFLIPIFFISVVLLFLREQVFNAWSKFSIIFLPIAIILVAITPKINGTLIGFDKESASLALATIFLIVSVFILAFKSFQLRGK
jgi:hypothetical protein